MASAPEHLRLSAIEARVLGALMEKQSTTPEVYPLTLKGLVAACNQTSARNPVLRVEPYEAEQAVSALKERRLARVVHPAAGERATRYRHVVDEALGLSDPERAVLCMLLLRGPQTPGELRTRTERIHVFPTTTEVEAALASLATRDEPLVARAGRQPGAREHRWVAVIEEGAEERATDAVPAQRTRPAGARTGDLEARVSLLEARLAALVDALGDLVDLASLADPDADPDADADAGIGEGGAGGR
ncbi:MAG: YceH family protein [Actinobacteria bacterium]|nr:YceH family protein [Actinomycetota bacterium]